MTDKQRRAINFIESVLEIKYKGSSDKDAWNFINKNLENAKKCAYFESQMSMPVFRASLGTDEEPELDLKRGLSRELLIRDLMHGKSASEAMTNFAANLFLENNDNHDLEIE